MVNEESYGIFKDGNCRGNQLKHRMKEKEDPKTMHVLSFRFVPNEGNESIIRLLGV